MYIIRKTKCSEKIKRNGQLYKTKCTFLGFPPYVKRLKKSFILRRFSITNICISRRKLLSLYSIYWDFTHSDIEFKLHRLISIKQSLGTVYIVLVYVHVSEVQRYVFQRQVYLSRHKVKVVYICRQP